MPTLFSRIPFLQKLHAHWRAEYVLLVLLVPILYLGFRQLDSTAMWDDETFTAFIGKNFLETGTFTGWDGRNLWAYRNGATLNEDFRSINPPLDSIVAAGSFAIFGMSTWSGRFPFVVAGLLSLGVLALILREAFPNRSWLWFYVLAAVGLSVNFLLNIRQCRYYALVLLLALSLYYGYRQFLKTREWRYVSLIAGSGVLLFYAHYMLCVAFMLALGAVHAVGHRKDFSLKDWGRAAVAAGAFLLLTTPYAVYFRIWERSDVHFSDPWHLRKLKLVWWNLRDLSASMFLPWMIVLLVVFLFVRNRNQHQKEIQIGWEWLLLGMGNVLFILLISPQTTNTTTAADMRYLIASLPFLIGFLGVGFWILHQQVSRWIALAVLACFLATNAPTAMPPAFHPWGWEIRWLLPAYVKEVHNDYPTSTQQAVRFLRKFAKPGDYVYTLPDHFNYPLMLYMGDQLKICCMLDRETPLPLDKLDALGAPLWINQNFPDWFLSFGNHHRTKVLVEHFSRPHLEGGKLVEYRYKLIGAIEVFWNQTQRPELLLHRFEPITEYKAAVDGVLVYQKQKE